MSVGLLGVLLIALSGVMLGVALPRSPERGEAVRFLRDRDGLQMTYVVAMTCPVPWWHRGNRLWHRALNSADQQAKRQPHAGYHVTINSASGATCSM